jgi:hypothetical protein
LAADAPGPVPVRPPFRLVDQDHEPSARIALPFSGLCGVSAARFTEAAMNTPDPILELTLMCMAIASATALWMSVAASLRARVQTVRAGRDA